MSYNNYRHNTYYNGYRLSYNGYLGYDKPGNGPGTPNGSNSYRPYKSYPSTSGPKTDKVDKTPSTDDTTGIKKNELTGTNMITGENSHDSQFDKLLIHADYLTSKLEKIRDRDISRNFKVVYDPELDKALSKSEKKAKSKKFHRVQDLVEVKDPRLTFNGKLESYLNKPNKRSKKFPFKQLPQTKFVYDEHSLGAEPLSELVIWDLPSNINEVYLTNFIQRFGNPIKDLKFVNDEENGVPLGIVTFKFQGNLEKSSRLANKLITDAARSGIKLDGIKLNIGLNDHDNKLLTSKRKLAEGKLRAERQKIQEEERAKFEELKKKKEEELKRKEQELKEKAKEEEFTKELTPRDKVETNITITSIKNNRRKISGYHLPSDLNKYIKDRPYIIIYDKYLSTKRVSSQDLKKVLSKYNWTRILSDRSGFFIVFNSLKECERCFYKEDGKRVFEYNIFMELCVPLNFKGDSKSNKENSDSVNEATNMLIKDFESYLTKDIRERIIAPAILDYLSDDLYPEIIKDLKAKEIQKVTPVVSNDTLKEKALSILSLQKKTVLPSFRKKITAPKRLGISKLNDKKKTIIPMLHALNFDNEESDSDEESSRSLTPVAPLKRQVSETSIEEEPKKKVRRSFLYDSSDEDQPEKMEIDEEIGEQDEEAIEDDKNEVDYSQLEEIYQPTFDFPRPTYEGFIPKRSKFDLSQFQDFIKDEEDFQLVKELYKDVIPASIKNIEYWAWKLKTGGNEGLVTEIDNDVDTLPSQFNSVTGSFKSDGYRKINDSDKIAYLPHRKKIHKPIKTIQHEGDDDFEMESTPSLTTTNNNTNNTKDTNQNQNHSSRVNRANNRRLAADISAQKQMIGSESDILNLNALAKRKKPVTFARSAIHNWGLYALDPIGAKEMIIEYVGESIRQQVAEHREKSYLKTGIGSSYLFRIDENTVIDATKKGGIARFINHSCSPSCTAKIIKVEGKKRIVIYALRDIEANEELTYDYKFERETNDAERIRCLCGAPGCKGYLN